MHYHGDSASAMADKIGVQRSSISHILSGRNKPSLDFVMKVLNAYNEVDLYWLLNGKGNYPSTPSETSNSQNSISEAHTPVINQEAKDIDRIVIFYKDGSFKDYFKS